MSINFRAPGGSATHESYDDHVYVQATAPGAGDDVEVGDVWSDTTASLLKRCTSVSPITFVSTEGGSSAHDVFSATHGDAATDTVARGDVVVGDITPELTLLTIGTADTVLKSDGADPAWGTVGHDELSDVAADDHHAESHTAASHSDQGATGAELETLTDGSDADALHTHDGKASTSHAAAHADGGADEVAVQDLASDAATDGQVAKADGAGAVAFEDDVAAITVIIDGGGSAITTGIKAYVEIPFACTIVQQTTLADQTGSIVLDIWKDAYANYPPTVADTITASAKPTISTGVKDQDATLTGWTTSISAGDVMAINVDSITTCERVTLVLKVTKT